MIKGEPWFVAADVCAILEIGRARDAVRWLPQKGAATTRILTDGGIQKVKIVNEANLYRLIFRSRKPEAEKFTDWVTGEVLPQIRKEAVRLSELRK
jgi:anti-repressor protein